MVSTPHVATLPLADLGGPALRSFFRLAETWQVRAAQQRGLLRDPPGTTF